VINDARPWLIAAGWMSAAASIAHLACMFGGPKWFIVLGAPKGFAYAAARGAILPYAVAVALATMLAVWAAFAFSAAGVIRRLPLWRLALVLISAVLLIRGCGYFIVPDAKFWRPDLSSTFMWWSSSICIVMGGCFAIGTWRAWPQLSQRTI
jgi:hypothetical protein